MTVSLTRAALLGRGARGGAALVVAGGAVGALAETASADPLPDQDLAYARLLVGAELLASDFYTQAIAASNDRRRRSRSTSKRAYLNEQEHYQSVAGILSGAGQTPAVSADVDFSYPTGTFDNEKSILKAAATARVAVLGDLPRCDRRHRRRTSSRPGSPRSPRARRSTRRTSRLRPAARPSGCRSRRPHDPAGLRRDGRLHVLGGRYSRMHYRKELPCSSRSSRARASASLARARRRRGAAAPPPSRPMRPPGVTVYAAASLTDVFPKIDPTATVQLRRLERARHADHERRAGRRASRRRTRAPGAALRARAPSRSRWSSRATRSSVVVPKSNPAGIKSIYDMAKPGVKIDIANSAVPVGAYTLQI